MGRLPKPGDPASAYSRLSFSLWESLSGKYMFYMDRWRRTIQFIRDQHWDTLNVFSPEVLPKWRRFPIHSYTLAYYNDYLSDFLKSEVRFSAVPISPDSRDIDSAELADQLLKYLWVALDMDKKRIDLASWLLACGTAYLRVYWNTNTGDQVPLAIPTPDGGMIPVHPLTLQPTVGEPVMVDRGEIAVEVVSPQLVRFADAPAYGVMVGILLTCEEAEIYYGEDVARRLKYSTEYQVPDLNFAVYPGVSPAKAERALVIEHYLPRSAVHPNGLWWTSSNDGSFLLHRPWELPAGRIPIISFRWIPIPGEPHLGLSPLYGLTFQNKAHEEILARILEWYQKAKPKRLLKQGGGIAPGDITDEPYQELTVNVGGEPEDMEVSDAPAGLFRVLDIIQRDMAITSGAAFEEAGELPEGLAISRFRAPAETKTNKSVSTAFHNTKASWKEVGETLLHYVSEFYNEPRVVAIQGADRSFLWKEFSGSSLKRGDSLAFTLFVDDIPLFPSNRQNLRDTVIAVLQSPAGQILFSGPDGRIDIDRVRAAIQAAGLDTSLDYTDPDVLEARNEHTVFQNWNGGDLPKPQSWQNHLTHYTEHANVLKSQSFGAWAPERQAMFIQHFSETAEILNRQAEEETQALVDQEQKMRRVRETEEVRADVIRQWAMAAINMVAETTGLEVKNVMEILKKNDQSDG